MKLSFRCFLPLAVAACLGLAVPAEGLAASADDAHEGGASGSIGRSSDKDRKEKAVRDDAGGREKAEKGAKADRKRGKKDDSAEDAPAGKRKSAGKDAGDPEKAEKGAKADRKRGKKDDSAEDAPAGKRKSAGKDAGDPEKAEKGAKSDRKRGKKDDSAEDAAAGRRKSAGKDAGDPEKAEKGAKSDRKRGKKDDSAEDAAAGKRKPAGKDDDRGDGGDARKRKGAGKDGDRPARKKGKDGEREPRTMTENSGERSLWLERARGNAEIATGIASWYSNSLHDSETASGCNYDMYTFTAAHRTLPLGTVVRVTDRANGQSVMVCVTDRGPYVAGRIIDLSYAAARKLRLQQRGIGTVDLEVVSDEDGRPLNRSDAYFVRYGSGAGGGNLGPFQAFADAAAMHEAVRTAHPEAEVVLGSADAPAE